MQKFNQRIVVLIDEVEALISAGGDAEALDQLRVVCEQTGGQLGVIIFGGSRLQELLQNDCSPFLRTAMWRELTGLLLDEVTALIRDPIQLTLEDEHLEAIWIETGGHPYVLQWIMERAWERNTLDYPGISTAIRDFVIEKAPTLFSVWWDNLRDRGQKAYHQLLSRGTPVRRGEWVNVLGSNPAAVVSVLTTTGVAVTVDEQLMLRGSSFAQWALREMAEGDPRSEMPVESSSKGGFVESLIGALTKCMNDILEYPVLFLNPDKPDQLLEQTAQFQTLLALRQTADWIVEPEALSAGKGEADLKVKTKDRPERRAVIEFKVWGRNNYREVAKQTEGYLVPTDVCACCVMIGWDGHLTSEKYRTECLETIQPAGDEQETQGTFGSGKWNPMIQMTECVVGGASVPMYHFVVPIRRPKSGGK